jgi:hypothetical protein
MDRESAETFLRLLVEAELRRLAEQPGDLAVQAGCITRVIQVARALIAVRALGDELAGQVLDDFEQALGRWQGWPPGRAGRDLRSLTRSTPPRGGRHHHAPAGDPAAEAPNGRGRGMNDGRRETQGALAPGG